MGWGYPVISADSHITEHPDTYVRYIDPKWRDKAPKMISANSGDLFVVDGMKRPIAMGLVAAAGKSAEELAMDGVRFDELHRGGWDPVARISDQDRDGVAAEVIYPTVGMVICNHDDFDYKKACFDAYNRWIPSSVSRIPTDCSGVARLRCEAPTRESPTSKRYIKQVYAV